MTEGRLRNVHGNVEEHERVGLREPPGARDNLVGGLAGPDVSQVLSGVWRKRPLDGVNGCCGSGERVASYANCKQETYRTLAGTNRSGPAG